MDAKSYQLAGLCQQRFRSLSLTQENILVPNFFPFFQLVAHFVPYSPSLIKQKQKRMYARGYDEFRGSWLPMPKTGLEARNEGVNIRQTLRNAELLPFPNEP